VIPNTGSRVPVSTFTAGCQHAVRYSATGTT
jgi:hypothetical protein